MSTRLFLLLALVALPAVAYAAPANFRELIELIMSYLDTITGVIITGIVAIYLGGSAHHLMKASAGEKSTELRKFLITGMGIVFVAVSIWGILEILRSTLEGGGGYSGDTGNAEVYCTDNYEDCLE